jgi:hypothetical protein
MRVGTRSRTPIFLLGCCGLLNLHSLTGDALAQTADRGDGQPAAHSETFVMFKYDDPMTGMEAFRLLIPKGWRASGSVTWSANPALPAQCRFRFHNPDGADEFNLYPTQSYFWTDNQLFLSTNPPGALRFGTLVAEPVDIHTAFTKIVIPGSGKDVSGLTIVREEDVPELAALARGQPVAGVRALAKGGKIRIRYRENGRQKDEELYAAVSQFVTDMPGSTYSAGYYINYWFIDYVFSFTAEAGGLDARFKTFQTMIYSLKVNPRWYARVVNVKESLVKRYTEGINAIGRIGEIIAQTGSQMREEQQRDWERRQEVQDRIARNFSDNIRGVERYNDPHSSNEVELPAGYGQAWANNLGEYIVTDSPGYNPNVGSNLHWEPMTPAK